MLAKLFFLSVFAAQTESILVETKELDLQTFVDYTDFNPRLRKAAGNVRENILKNKREKAILLDFNRLVSNDSIQVDGIPHFKVTASWKKVQDIENDFKNLISMKSGKYVYQRDAHWRTWREIKDSNGKKKIICYKCQSKIRENCTDCEGRGIWVIEEGLPPCPYEIFSTVNSNELCAANYTQLSGEIQPCASIIKYADLTKSCNNPIVTRWRFTRNYKLPGRLSTAICEGREYCEISTLYQIKPEYVVFRILQSNNIIYSRVMKINKKNFACTTNCGAIDLATYKVTKNDEKSALLDLLPNKEKRQSDKNKRPKKYTGNFISTDSYIPKAQDSNRNLLQNKTSPSGRLNLKVIRTSKKRRHALHRRPESLSKVTGTHEQSPLLEHPHLKWVKTDNGYYIQELAPVETATEHEPHCKRIADKHDESSRESTNDDSFEHAFEALY